MLGPLYYQVTWFFLLKWGIRDNSHRFFPRQLRYEIRERCHVRWTDLTTVKSKKKYRMLATRMLLPVPLVRLKPVTKWTWAYRHFVNHGGGADDVVVLLGVLLHMILHPEHFLFILKKRKMRKHWAKTVLRIRSDTHHFVRSGSGSIPSKWLSL